MNGALGMLEWGRSQRQVAATFNVSKSVISGIFSRFQTSGSVNRRHNGGSERVTTALQHRVLVIQQRFQNTTLRNDLQNTAGSRVSSQSVRNLLQHTG
jgi:transposase